MNLSRWNPTASGHASALGFLELQRMKVEWRAPVTAIGSECPRGDVRTGGNSRRGDNNFYITDARHGDPNLLAHCIFSQDHFDSQGFVAASR